MSLIVGPPGRGPRAVTQDTQAPTITAFTVSNGYDTTHGASTALAITGITLTASGDPTGFLINESATPPAAGDVNIYPAPTTYTASGSVTKYAHLYAWARDAAGNVSAAAEAYVLCWLCNASSIALNSVVDSTHYNITIGYDGSASAQANDWTPTTSTTITVTDGVFQVRFTGTGERMASMISNWAMRIDSIVRVYRHISSARISVAFAGAEIADNWNQRYDGNPCLSACIANWNNRFEFNINGTIDATTPPNVDPVSSNVWYTITNTIDDAGIVITWTGHQTKTKSQDISASRSYTRKIALGAWGTNVQADHDYDSITVTGTVLVS